MSISPWSGSANEISPNGKNSAQIVSAGEIAMGAPTSGCLEIKLGGNEESIKVTNCNPSLIWSEDSKYLALPKWTKERWQRILIVDIDERTTHLSVETYGVLELHSFKDGVITGVDSPFYQPSNFSVKLDDVLCHSRPI